MILELGLKDSSAKSATPEICNRAKIRVHKSLNPCANIFVSNRKQICRSTLLNPRAKMFFPTSAQLLYPNVQAFIPDANLFFLKQHRYTVMDSEIFIFNASFESVFQHSPTLPMSPFIQPPVLVSSPAGNRNPSPNRTSLVMVSNLMIPKATKRINKLISNTNQYKSSINHSKYIISFLNPNAKIFLSRTDSQNCCFLTFLAFTLIISSFIGFAIINDANSIHVGISVAKNALYPAINCDLETYNPTLVIQPSDSRNPSTSTPNIGEFIGSDNQRISRLEVTKMKPSKQTHAFRADHDMLLNEHELSSNVHNHFAPSLASPDVIDLSTPEVTFMTDTLDEDEENSPYFILQNLRIRNIDKIIFGHLNINSIRNKFELFTDLVAGRVDIILISETKLNDSFPVPQFNIAGYSTLRRDRTENGGGLLFYSRNDIPTKSLLLLFGNIECILSEITISKKKMVSNRNL